MSNDITQLRSNTH